VTFNDLFREKINYLVTDFLVADPEDAPEVAWQIGTTLACKDLLQEFYAAGAESTLGMGEPTDWPLPAKKRKR
jgi:hypothetical protein